MNVCGDCHLLIAIAMQVKREVSGAHFSYQPSLALHHRLGNGTHTPTLMHTISEIKVKFMINLSFPKPKSIMPPPQPPPLHGVFA